MQLFSPLVHFPLFSSVLLWCILEKSNYVEKRVNMMQCALVTLVLQGSSHWLTALLLSTPHLLLMHINKTTRSLWGTKKTKDFLTTLTFFFPLQQFASGSLPLAGRCILLKIQCLCGKITPQKKSRFFFSKTAHFCRIHSGNVMEYNVWNWPYMYYIQAPCGIKVTHTRISTSRVSSRGHYSCTLQLAIFDKKKEM